MKFPLQQFLAFAGALKIDSKERGVISLGDSLLGTQKWVLEKIISGLEDDVHDFVTLKCCDPNMRVLRADLTWVPIKDIVPGDELVAFDEHKPTPTTERKMRTATVKAKWSSIQRAYRVTFTDGGETIVTRDHRHLVQARGGTVLQWKPVSWLKPGDKIRKVVTPWETRSSCPDKTALDHMTDGRELPDEWAVVERIEELNDREMVDIETTTGTFICEGLANHNCRQAGISTISLALDMFWLFRHKGMNGMMAVHEDTARDSFRSTLELYYASLPDAWKRPIKDHNRNQLVLTTGTKLLYRVAGTKKTGKGSLGRSSAISFLHATEMSSWGDPEGYASLRASLAQKNPTRLYHWESTARGFENLFYDQWEEAKAAASQKAIFVSWWANEFYRISKEDPLYRVYFGPKGRINAQEREWAKEVKQLYGVDVGDEQIAWWRWLSAEQQTDEAMRLQEYPWTEHQAFQASGSQFFSSTELSRLYQDTNKIRNPEFYRLSFKDNFIETEIHQATVKNATLKVWKNPEKHGFYVLGADPAYGSSENADGFAISVWRVWGDHAEQVAEYVDYSITTSQFAWAIAYLAGAYGPCTFNLEVSGPGHAVLNEILNMRKERTLGLAQARPVLKDVLSSMRDFLYRKYDSIGGTAGAIHTQTSYAMKERMMNTMRDYVERKMAVPVSRELVSEMSSIQRVAGSAPAAASHRKDDRVIAAALAILAWNDQVRSKLMGQGIMYQSPLQIEAEKAVQGMQVAGPRMVRQYMKDLGLLYTKTDVTSNVKVSRHRTISRT